MEKLRTAHVHVLHRTVLRASGLLMQGNTPPQPEPSPVPTPAPTLPQHASRSPVPYNGDSAGTPRTTSHQATAAAPTPRTAHRSTAAPKTGAASSPSRSRTGGVSTAPQSRSRSRRRRGTKRRRFYSNGGSHVDDAGASEPVSSPSASVASSAPPSVSESRRDQDRPGAPQPAVSLDVVRSKLRQIEALQAQRWGHGTRVTALPQPPASPSLLGAATPPPVPSFGAVTPPAVPGRLGVGTSAGTPPAPRMPRDGKSRSGSGAGSGASGDVSGSGAPSHDWRRTAVDASPASSQVGVSSSLSETHASPVVGGGELDHKLAIYRRIRADMAWPGLKDAATPHSGRLGASAITNGRHNTATKAAELSETTHSSPGGSSTRSEMAGEGTRPDSGARNTSPRQGRAQVLHPRPSSRHLSVDIKRGDSAGM